MWACLPACLPAAAAPPRQAYPATCNTMQYTGTGRPRPPGQCHGPAEAPAGTGGVVCGVLASVPADRPTVESTELRLSGWSGGY